MSQSKEFYAPTVEEAVRKASESLGVPVDQLAYETIDSGAAGFLGIGARDARVMVEVEDAGSSPAQPVETDTEETTPPVFEEREIDTESPGTAPASADEQSSLEEPVPESLLEEVRTLVSSIVEAMDVDARIDTYDAGDVIAVDIASEETGLIIGQKGETIDALQLLVNVAAYKDHEFSKRIVLDSEGYRQRRVEAIQGMAHRTARKVVREDQPVELPPMNSSERRIVHMYLKENERVITYSEGSGPGRRVTVAPNQE